MGSDSSSDERGLRLTLPDGSLWEVIKDLFYRADMPLQENGDRIYTLQIKNSYVSMLQLLRPSESPKQVAAGRFDLAITGWDWVVESGFEDEVVKVCELPLSRAKVGFAKIVIAVKEDSDIKTVQDLEGKVIESEYVKITVAYLKSQGVTPREVNLSRGNTEGKVPYLCDAIVELTETGGSLKANRLRVIAEIMSTKAWLIANPDTYADKNKREIIDGMATILLGTVKGQNMVEIKFHLPANKLNVLNNLPAQKVPTVVPVPASIASLLGRDDMVACSIVVPRYDTDDCPGAYKIKLLLKKAGALDIYQTAIEILIA